MMLKLKLQYFGHLMQRVDSLEKPLMLGGIGGKRRRGRQRMRWLDGITDSMDVNSGSWCWTGRPGVLRFMGSQRVGHDWATDLIWSDLWNRLQLLIIPFWDSQWIYYSIWWYLISCIGFLHFLKSFILFPLSLCNFTYTVFQLTASFLCLVESFAGALSWIHQFSHCILQF